MTNDPAEINIYLLDGSLIDEEEYFSTLKPQTTLILQKPGEKVLSGWRFAFESFFFFFKKRKKKRKKIFEFDSRILFNSFFSLLLQWLQIGCNRKDTFFFTILDADLLYDTLRRVNIDFLIAGEKASEFLAENLKAKVAVLNTALNKDDSKTAFSSRDEHPDWFQGLETNCATKVSPLRFLSSTNIGDEKGGTFHSHLIEKFAREINLEHRVEYNFF